MKRFQMENIYEANSLSDYSLETTNDLLKVHGLNFEDTLGFDNLTDENKSIYENFIVRFFNMHGLDRRMEIIPKGINFVEDIEFLVKEEPDQDYYNYAGQVVTRIDKEGNRKIIKKKIIDRFKDREIIKDKPKYYLRFEYEYGEDEEGNPFNEWLHVTHGGTQWY